jgi:tetracycline 7-halogenase / FADH2 O2-dependent halogenase
MERAPYRGVQGIDFEPFGQLVASAADTLRGYRAGEYSRDRAVSRIYQAMRDSELCPGSWNLLDPNDHTPAGTFTVVPLLRTLLWGRFRSPSHVRGTYFTGGALVVAKEAVRHVVDDLFRGALMTKESSRDLFITLNRDWKRRVTDRPTGARMGIPPTVRYPWPEPAPDGMVRELVPAFDAEERL